MQKRFNCSQCLHFRRIERGAYCRFRGAKPTGICVVFVWGKG